MSAPWQPPAANDPRAIGLKNGGLSDIAVDVIYPASRLVDQDFQAGSQLEFRWRSDSARQFVPRESRLFVEYDIVLGETASTGSGTEKTRIVNPGEPAPKRLDAAASGRARGAPPNGNLAFSAAPNAQLFSQARLMMNSVTVENNPHYPTTAMAHLRTKTELGAAATTGSAMLNSLEKTTGQDPLSLCNRSEINFKEMLQALPPAVKDQFNAYNGLLDNITATAQFYKTDGRLLSGDVTRDLKVLLLSSTDSSFPTTAGDIVVGATMIQRTRAKKAEASADDRFDSNSFFGRVIKYSERTGTSTAGVLEVLCLGGDFLSDIGADAVPFEIFSDTADPKVLDMGTVTGTLDKAETRGAKDSDLTALIGSTQAATNAGLEHVLTERKRPMRAKDMIFSEAIGCRTFAKGNPKTDILAMGYAQSGSKAGIITCQVAEPLFLSTFNHPYAMPSSDFQLQLQISRDFLRDLFWCSDYSYGCFAGNGSAISPIPSTGIIDMGQIYVSIKKVELHAQFYSPQVPQIPRSIGIKYTSMQVTPVLLQQPSVQEQIVVPPSTRAVYIFLRQRYHNVAACNEELGRAMNGVNEFVTICPTRIADGRPGHPQLTDAQGQPDPKYQGRAIPHNLATLHHGTPDGWIPAGTVDGTQTADEASNKYQGPVYYLKGEPAGPYVKSTAADPGNVRDVDANSVDLQNGTYGYSFGYNVLSSKSGEDAIQLRGDGKTGASRVVQIPRKQQLLNEQTAFFTDFHVRLGQAQAPSTPYSELDPTVGKMVRPWSDYISTIGKPLGLRAGVDSFAEYCGFKNHNGISAPGMGSNSGGFFLRILNPPNSLANVLTVNGVLNRTPQAAAQLEMVVIALNDSFLTCEWAPPAEVPIKTETRSVI